MTFFANFVEKVNLHYPFWTHSGPLPPDRSSPPWGVRPCPRMHTYHPSFNRQLQQRLESLRTQLATSTERVEFKEKEIASLEESMQLTAAEKRALDDQLGDARKELDDFRTETEQLQLLLDRTRSERDNTVYLLDRHTMHEEDLAEKANEVGLRAHSDFTFRFSRWTQSFEI